MTHSYLLQPGHWQIHGHWLDRNESPIPLTGTSLVKWKREQWFTIVTEFTIGQRYSAVKAVRPLRVQQFLQRGEPPQRTASPRRRKRCDPAEFLLALAKLYPKGQLYPKGLRTG